MRHLTCDPGAEVLGSTMLSFLSSLNAARIRLLFEKHGLSDIDPAQWYSCQKWLGFINDLVELSGYTVSSSMVAVGLRVAEYQTIPPELENASLSQILECWNEIYQMQHRGEVGEIETVKVGDNHYKCIHRNIYPDDLHYGVAYGMARRYLPPGTEFTVMFDETAPPMDRGGDQTVIHVKWGSQG